MLCCIESYFISEFCMCTGPHCNFHITSAHSARLLDWQLTIMAIYSTLAIFLCKSETPSSILRRARCVCVWSHQLSLRPRTVAWASLNFQARIHERKAVISSEESFYQKWTSPPALLSRFLTCHLSYLPKQVLELAKNTVKSSNVMMVWIVKWRPERNRTY